MTHTCTNTLLLTVFKEQNNCAILVIYCNIFFIYVFFELTEAHVPCSEVQQCGSAFFWRKDVLGLKLQCWNVEVLVVMLCGHLRAAEEQVSVTMLISLLLCQLMWGQETNRKVYLVFYLPLSWLCKVTFFRIMLFKNCLHVEKKKHKVHNAREDTLKALYYCNIVDV